MHGLGVGVGGIVAVAVAVAVGVAQLGVGLGQPAIVQLIAIPSAKLAALQENWLKADPVSFCRPTVALEPVPFNVP